MRLIQGLKQRLGKTIDLLRQQPSGQRFMAYKNMVSQQSQYPPIVRFGLSLILIVAGLLLSIPPGIPGFLLWVPGFALLASCSQNAAALLDRFDLFFSRLWHSLKSRYQAR